VPGLDLPGLDIASLARAYGRPAVDVDTVTDPETGFRAAQEANTIT